MCDIALSQTPTSFRTCGSPRGQKRGDASRSRPPMMPCVFLAVSPVSLPDGVSDYVDLSGWKMWGLGAVVALLTGRWLYRKVRRAIRRRRGFALHPKLEKYGDHREAEAEVAAKRREEASRIVATSSTATIAGYEIAEQVEAVFVDGFRRPEEALEGLKAVAAMKGANAVANVRHDRDAGGHCDARGDAVIVRRLHGTTTPDDEFPSAD